MNKLISKEILILTVIDFLVLSLVIFLPAISHLLPFPMYFLDPMRIMLFVGFILSKNSTNAYILAVSIPLFSFFVTGHPVLPKAILIAIELLVNLSFFLALIIKFKEQVFICMFISILFSKIIYYIFKYYFISLNFIDGSLISTSLITQFIISISATLVFTYFYKKSIT
jgi:hypothetical protein